MQMGGLFRQVVTGLFLSIAVAIASPAQTFTTIAAFDRTNGFFPNGALIQGLDGNLYGTTQEPCQ
jgi:hypothetical protein